MWVTIINIRLAAFRHEILWLQLELIQMFRGQFRKIKIGLSKWRKRKNERERDRGGGREREKVDC